MSNHEDNVGSLTLALNEHQSNSLRNILKVIEAIPNKDIYGMRKALMAKAPKDAVDFLCKLDKSSNPGALVGELPFGERMSLMMDACLFIAEVVRNGIDTGNIQFFPRERSGFRFVERFSALNNPDKI